MSSGHWMDLKMAEEETKDSRNDGNDNIFEILQKQAKLPLAYVNPNNEVIENGNDIDSKRDQKCFRNLPGLQIAHAAHVAKEDQNKQSDRSLSLSPTDAKRPKITSMPTTYIPDPCVSPDTGKRRRIQHDYRRLSNSGYLDDYVGRERRFSSTSDSSEISVSPSPPKQKHHSNNCTTKATSNTNGSQKSK